MKGVRLRVKGANARLTVLLLIAMLVTIPMASAYLNPQIDMTEYARDETCYCHGVEVSPNVTIVIEVADKVFFNDNNDTIPVQVGILGDPQNITGFALYLNGTESNDNLRWEYSFGLSDGQVERPREWIKINGSAVWPIVNVTEKYFNLSFFPGSVDQDVVISVTGMRANGNVNKTGDLWNVARTTVKVREQRMATLNVTVTNTEPIAVSDVLVDFYVDGGYIGNYTIPHIGENGGENATVQWDITYEKDGKHELRAVIDPDGRITVLDRDEIEITTEIWLGERPEEPDYALYYGLGSVLVGVLIIVAIFWYWRRRQYRF